MMRDSRTPVLAKVLSFSIIALMLAYTFSPFDIIPDYIPLAGILDDLILFPLGIALIERLLPRQVLVENRAIARQRVNRVLLRMAVVAAAIFLLWTAFITLLVIFIIKVIWVQRDNLYSATKNISQCFSFFSVSSLLIRPVVPARAGMKQSLLVALSQPWKPNIMENKEANHVKEVAYCPEIE